MSVIHQRVREELSAEVWRTQIQPQNCLSRRWRSNQSLCIRSSKEERIVDAENFFRGMFETAIQPSEMLVEIRIPSSPAAGSGFEEVALRKGDFAIVSVAAWLVVGNDNVCTSARVVLGSVGPKPVRCLEVEANLTGRAVNAAVVTTAANAIPEHLIESDSLECQPRLSAAHRPSAHTTRSDRGVAGREKGGTMTKVRTIINGRRAEFETEPRQSLADAIRNEIGLTGTHLGCEHGVCGACTVLLDGEAVRSCLMLAVQAEGASITTIEGISLPHSGLTELQAAFRARHALQCRILHARHGPSVACIVCHKSDR